MVLFNVEEDEEEVEVEAKPNFGEYWKVKNGANFLYAIVSNENPLVMKYFAPSVKGNYFSLDETQFDVCAEDLEKKIEAPEIIQKGRRKFYLFD